MQQNDSTVIRSGSSESILATNTILRKTYILLSLSLLFSAAMAGVAMTTNAPPIPPLLTIIGYFGLLFITRALQKSPLGIVGVFALTGFMGYTLGPLLTYYIRSIPNGQELVMMAFGSTGIIFLGLSGYAVVSRKDFSYLGGFVMVGMMVAFLAGIGAMFFHAPLLSLCVAAAFVLLSSGLILLQTSQIINGGETSYVMATITLYVSIYNIFISLLQIFGVLNNRN